MEEQHNDHQSNDQQRNSDVVFTKRIRAGRRTYFFDVRTTRGNDYYLTITESKKRPDDTYVKHKIFVYKEDFNKFVAGLDEAVAKIKTDLMPDFNFEQFDRPYDQQGGDHYNPNYHSNNQGNGNYQSNGYDQQPSQDGQPTGNYQTNEPIEPNDDYNTAPQAQAQPQARVDQNANVQNESGSDDDLKW